MRTKQNPLGRQLVFGIDYNTPPMSIIRFITTAALACLAVSAAWAHGITGADQEFLINNVGPQIGPYIYLGAKHMVTGYDHLAFLAGVIFFPVSYTHLTLPTIYSV